MDIVTRLDERGRGAWIFVMILGFVLFWPIGLAILAYMIWSGRMGCMHNGWDNHSREEWRARKHEWKERKREWRDYWRSQKEEMRERGHQMADDLRHEWFGHRHPTHSSGNAAFDEYKAETLRRLEDEQAEFTEFLDNLRKSKDKAEFDQFMQSRKHTIDPDRRPDDNSRPTA